jgi:hypothetical protein
VFPTGRSCLRTGPTFAARAATGTTASGRF